MITSNMTILVANSSVQHKTALFKQSKIAALLTLALIVSGCSSTMMNPDKAVEVNKVKVDNSFLKNDKAAVIDEQDAVEEEEKNSGEFVRLNNSTDNKQSLKLEIDLSKQFGSEKDFQMSVNELPLNDFFALRVRGFT